MNTSHSTLVNTGDTFKDTLAAENEDRLLSEQAFKDDTKQNTWIAAVQIVQQIDEQTNKLTMDGWMDRY